MARAARPGEPGGLESQEQLHFLRERSRDEIEGYYVSHAIAMTETASFARWHGATPLAVVGAAD